MDESHLGADEQIARFAEKGRHLPYCCGVHGTYGMCLREVRPTEWLTEEKKCDG